MYAAISRLALVSVTLSFALPTWASDSSSSCDNPLQSQAEIPIPEVLVRHVTPWFRVEMPEAGLTLNLMQKAPDLPSSEYVYLITSTLELVLAPKYDLVEHHRTGRGVATHKSLLTRYRLNLGDPSLEQRVVAAGEFRMAFGLVVMVNNRSGNFRAPNDRLPFVLSTLRRYGFRVSSNPSVIQPFDECHPLGHCPGDRARDEFILNVMAKIEESPQASQILQLYTRLGRLLVDSSGADMRQIPYLFRRDPSDKIWAQGLSSFLYPILSADSSDGIHYGVYLLLRNLVEPNATQAESFAALASRHLAQLSEAQRSRWPNQKFDEIAAIAKAFAELGPLQALPHVSIDSPPPQRR